MHIRSPLNKNQSRINKLAAEIHRLENESHELACRNETEGAYLALQAAEDLRYESAQLEGLEGLTDANANSAIRAQSHQHRDRKDPSYNTIRVSTEDHGICRLADTHQSVHNPNDKENCERTCRPSTVNPRSSSNSATDRGCNTQSNRNAFHKHAATRIGQVLQVTQRRERKVVLPCKNGGL